MCDRLTAIHTCERINPHVPVSSPSGQSREVFIYFRVRDKLSSPFLDGIYHVRERLYTPVCIHYIYTIIIFLTIRSLQFEKIKTTHYLLAIYTAIIRPV